MSSFGRVILSPTLVGFFGSGPAYQKFGHPKFTFFQAPPPGLVHTGTLFPALTPFLLGRPVSPPGSRLGTPVSFLLAVSRRIRPNPRQTDSLATLSVRGALDSPSSLPQRPRCTTQDFSGRTYLSHTKAGEEVPPTALPPSSTLVFCIPRSFWFYVQDKKTDCIPKDLSFV